MIYKSSLAYPLEPKWEPKKYPPKNYGTSPYVTPQKNKKNLPKIIHHQKNNNTTKFTSLATGDFSREKYPTNPPMFQAVFRGHFSEKTASSNLMPPLAPTANPVFQDRYVERFPYLEDGIPGLGERCVCVCVLTTPVYKSFSWLFWKGSHTT